MYPNQGYAPVYNQNVNYSYQNPQNMNMGGNNANMDPAPPVNYSSDQPAYNFNSENVNHGNGGNEN